MAGVLSDLEAAWTAAVPDQPITYAFLDQNVEALYADERRLSRFFAACAGLALLVACLGLFGLAAFTTRQRYKEIGIRKALGASVLGVAALMSSETIALVCIGALVGGPAAWVAARYWLDGFAYHVPLGPAAFGLALGVVLALALGTVATLVLRAARVNPALVLRDE